MGKSTQITTFPAFTNEAKVFSDEKKIEPIFLQVWMLSMLLRNCQEN